MKLIINSYKQNQFKLILISFVAFLGLTYVFTQLLTVQASPSPITTNHQIFKNTKQLKPIPYNRLVIGGISLGMSEEQVKETLGDPLNTKNGYEEVAGKTRILQYPGLTVQVLEDTEATNKFFVYHIESNSYKYTTVDGVKVGDSVSKVMKIYGKPKSRDTNSLSYDVENSSPTYFNFNIKNGKVTKIIFGDFLG